MFHEVEGPEIVVAGNDSQKFAEVFHVETRRPMLNGLLNPREPHSLAVVRSIITKLIGKAAAEGQKIFFSVPAPPANGEDGISYHEASIRQILTELGYEPTSIEEGLAVVFGELGGANYSGIGISCGSGLCNVCLAVLSVPVISFSVPKAGDFIDAQAARVTGDLATRMRIQKEQSFHLNGLSGDRVQNALTVYYREMIASLVEALRGQVSSSQAPAQARSIGSPGAQRRLGRTQGLSRAILQCAAIGRIPASAFRNPRVRRSPEFHRQGRPHGGALLAAESSMSHIVLLLAVLCGLACGSLAVSAIRAALQHAWDHDAGQRTDGQPEAMRSHVSNPEGSSGRTSRQDSGGSAAAAAGDRSWLLHGTD